MKLEREVSHLIKGLDLRFNSVSMLIELRERWGHDVSMTSSVKGSNLIWEIKVHRQGLRSLANIIYLPFKSLVNYHDPEYVLNSKFMVSVHELDEVLNNET